MKNFMKSCVVSFVPDSFSVNYVGVIPNIGTNLSLSFFWLVTLHELADLKMYTCFRRT
jgi:hypothetical protein